VYTSVRNRPPGTASPKLSRGTRVAGNVVALGLVSMFTDISQEMVTAVVPLYLTFELRLSPLQFGLIDGLYHGATALVRLLGGYFADLRERHKEVAATGYGISAACKLGLLLAGRAWAPTTGFLMLDRLGKGVRTAPRDALISLSSPHEELGKAFGVHRALDTTGALLGPLVAFFLLAAIPGAFDAVFFVSFCIALIGLAVLFLFVHNPPPRAESSSAVRISLRRAFGLVRGRAFRSIVVVGAGLSLLTMSDAFVYLTLQRTSDIATAWFPLLFLGTALVYLTLAIPLGRVADRVGRARVFVAGHVALAGVYALLLMTWLGFVQVVLVLALFGVYYAATDGVLMALASGVIPEELRTSGLALVATAVALGRFASSLAFGAMWNFFDSQLAVIAFLVVLLVSVPFAARHLYASQEARA